jgi:hypothetical protein
MSLVLWAILVVVVVVVIYMIWNHSKGKSCTSQDDCGEGDDQVCRIPSGATKGRCVHTGSPVV